MGGGNTNPSSDSIVKILSSVGIEAEADKLEKVIAELSGKYLKTVIAEGQAKLATCLQVVVPPQLPLLLHPLLPLLLKPRRKRRRRNLRKKMTTWDSVSSTNSTHFCISNFVRNKLGNVT